MILRQWPAICSVMIQPSILTMRRATNDREAGQSQNYDSDQVST